MARPVWTGSISFGLVNVPVKAYTAVRDHDVHFNQLEKGSGSRIRNRKVAEKSGKEVEADDIEMGFEIRKGRYVTFDKKELDELRPASTRMIEVSDFVALDEIDPIYYERTYWLGPDGDTGSKAYHLLLGAMEERGRVASGPSSCATSSTSRPCGHSTACWRCRRCGSPTRSSPEPTSTGCPAGGPSPTPER